MLLMHIITALLTSRPDHTTVQYQSSSVVLPFRSFRSEPCTLIYKPLHYSTDEDKTSRSNWWICVKEWVNEYTLPKVVLVLHHQQKTGTNQSSNVANTSVITTKLTLLCSSETSTSNKSNCGSIAWFWPNLPHLTMLFILQPTCSPALPIIGRQLKN